MMIFTFPMLFSIDFPTAEDGPGLVRGTRRHAARGIRGRTLARTRDARSGPAPASVPVGRRLGLHGLHRRDILQLNWYVSKSLA